jgi:hypothetical protein
MNQPAQSPGVPPSPLKPYTTPILTTFGELALLTKGSGGAHCDSNGSSSPIPGSDKCHD